MRTLARRTTRRAIEDKESRWRSTLQAQLEATLRAKGAATVPRYQSDCEADASHVLMRGIKPGSLVTARAHQDRLLTAEACRRKHLKLHAAVTSAPAMGVMWLVVPRGKGRAERLARLEVRVVCVGLKLRGQWSRGWLADVAVTAVGMREVEIVARLGGYTGKSAGGPPGIKVFARGMDRVETAALVLRLQRLLTPARTSGEGFG